MKKRGRERVVLGPICFRRVAPSTNWDTIDSTITKSDNAVD